jgi:hypothetical protein
VAAVIERRHELGGVLDDQAARIAAAGRRVSAQRVPHTHSGSWLAGGVCSAIAPSGATIATGIPRR